MYTYVHTCGGQKITLDIIPQALSPCVKRHGFPSASASQIRLSRLSRQSQGALRQLRAGIICPGHHTWLLCAFCSYRTWLITLASPVLLDQSLPLCLTDLLWGWKAKDTQGQMSLLQKTLLDPPKRQLFTPPLNSGHLFFPNPFLLSLSAVHSLPSRCVAPPGGDTFSLLDNISNPG